MTEKVVIKTNIFSRELLEKMHSDLKKNGENHSKQKKQGA